jgi:HD-GYP domain-containing protein (c-di-GMP phosphodiesterase class II)
MEEAVEELHRCCGTQFDPNIVKAFIRSMETAGDPGPHATVQEPLAN